MIITKKTLPRRTVLRGHDGLLGGRVPFHRRCESHDAAPTRV